MSRRPGRVCPRQTTQAIVQAISNPAASAWSWWLLGKGKTKLNKVSGKSGFQRTSQWDRSNTASMAAATRWAQRGQSGPGGAGVRVARLEGRTALVRSGAEVGAGRRGLEIGSASRLGGCREGSGSEGTSIRAMVHGWLWQRAAHEFGNLLRSDSLSGVDLVLEGC